MEQNVSPYLSIIENILKNTQLLIFKKRKPTQIQLIVRNMSGDDDYTALR